MLELGCGDGANVLPMALSLPGSEFVGIDSSARALSFARERAAALGLRNVRFEQADIAEVSIPHGEFDYVVAHGVYSWVDAHVRDRLLALCATGLRSQGVAYVSYNALPGGHIREALREMMRFHVRTLTEPEERVAQARALLELLRAGWSDTDAFGSLMSQWAGQVGERSDETIYHDDLAETNEAFYFHDFISHAARHGLQFLAEADFFEMQVGVLPEPVSEALAALDDDVLTREQYLDFLKGRLFRQTLLCSAESRLNRSPQPELLMNFSVASPARPATPDPDLSHGGPVEFLGPKGASLRSDHWLVKAAFVRIGESWPRALPVAELVEDPGAAVAGPPDAGDVRALCDALLRSYAGNLVQLHLYPPSFALEAGQRPTASPLARLQASSGPVVTNLRHASVRLEDELGRHLITLLDGTRDRGTLLTELERFVGSGAVGLGGEETAALVRELPAALERSLEGLGRLALLSA